MGNIFLTAKSGDDNKGRGLHGGQWLKGLNFGRFLVGCNMGCKGPLQYRSLLTSVATCYGARLRTHLQFPKAARVREPEHSCLARRGCPSPRLESSLPSFRLECRKSRIASLFIEEGSPVASSRTK